MKEYVYVVTELVGYVPVSFVFRDESRALMRYGKERDAQVGLYRSCWGFEPEHKTFRSDNGGECVVWYQKNYGDDSIFFTPMSFVSFRRVELM